MEIVIVGVGYVGLVTGTCFAEMGHHVTCIDINKNEIEKLKKGQISFYEPGLQELMQRNQQGKRLHFSDSHESIATASIVFITVGTPSTEEGAADLAQVKEAARSIAMHMNDYLVIVTKSTVPVGTGKEVKKLIRETLSQYERDIPFDIVSNPEFLREGSAIEDCMKPDRIIIGSDSEKATQILQELYSAFTLNHERILIMDIPSAELTKYASNAMLATRISFMNELSTLCEKIGANINNVRIGMSSDTRIGYHSLYAGVGYGGSCLPKDIRALKMMFKQSKLEAPIIEAVESINEKQKKRLCKKICDHFAKKGGVSGKTIALWGLAYKPNTDDIREAPSLMIVESLLSKGALLRVYDPIAMKNIQKIFKNEKRISFCLNEYQAAQNAHAIILLTEWKQFRFVNLKRVLTKMRGNAFFDGRNQYKPKEMVIRGFRYFGIGTPPIAADLLRELRSIGKKKAMQYEKAQFSSTSLFD